MKEWNFIKVFQEAQEQAFEKGIEANSVVINEKLDYCKEFWIKNGFSFSKIPPMILGKQLLCFPLPEQYNFALFRTEEETYQEKLERENALLKKYIKIIGENDNEQLVFKGVSTKRNKEDFYKIKELL